MTNGKRFLSFFLITAFVVAAGPAAAQTADVLVIHNSPDPAAEVVDVYLDGAIAVPGFAFRTAGVVELPAGQEIEIGIAPGPGSEVADIIGTFPFTLTAGESYVVMATGVLDGSLPSNPDGIDTGFTLIPFEGWRTTANAGEVGLLLHHGAPDAPAVDVLARDVGPLFEGVSFEQFSPDYVDVPADSYIVDVTVAGDPAAVAGSFTADLSTLGGGAAVVFASGFLGASPAFGVFAALPDGTVLQLPPTDIVDTEASSFGGLKAGYGN
ncbi:MAG TPA: DUF4397 domain-containing protein [Candidatus Krumholzibacteria bacterium]|nr:DUF4397 domain-containing protein [Candidatus Krumholzibacteria bacterium]